MSHIETISSQYCPTSDRVAKSDSDDPIDCRRRSVGKRAGGDGTGLGRMRPHLHHLVGIRCAPELLVAAIAAPKSRQHAAIGMAAL